MPAARSREIKTFTRERDAVAKALDPVAFEQKYIRRPRITFAGTYSAAATVHGAMPPPLCTSLSIGGGSPRRFREVSK